MRSKCKILPYRVHQWSGNSILPNLDPKMRALCLLEANIKKRTMANYCRDFFFVVVAVAQLLVVVHSWSVVVVFVMIWVVLALVINLATVGGSIFCSIVILGLDFLVVDGINLRSFPNSWIFSFFFSSFFYLVLLTYHLEAKT